MGSYQNPGQRLATVKTDWHNASWFGSGMNRGDVIGETTAPGLQASKPSNRAVGRTVAAFFGMGGADFSGGGDPSAGNPEAAGGYDTSTVAGTGGTSGAGGISTDAGGSATLAGAKDAATLLTAASAVYNATKPTDKGPTSPDATPPPTLPTSISYDTQRSSLSEQLLRRGRASTILTSNSLGA